MMERQFARFFIRVVKEIIPDNEERSKLFEALKRYQSNQDLHRLLVDLKKVLNEPARLEIYDLMRPLVSVKHQLDFSLRSPMLPGVKLRVVRLQRRTNESLGFAVKGGFEHGIGMFVTEVIPGSQADRQGLKVGDEIVRVNGFTLAEAIHDDVLNLIRSREDIILKVTYVGMVPVKEEATDTVTWRYVDNNEIESEMDELILPRRDPQSEIKIYVDLSGQKTLGCTIQSDSAVVQGIFVEKVRPGSVAEEVGLEPGDQLVEVNETSFKNLSHQQAVLALKSSRQLHMTIRKGVGLQYFRNLAKSKPAPPPPSAPPMENSRSPAPPPPPVVSPAPPRQENPTSPGIQGRRFLEDIVNNQAKMIEQQLSMNSSNWLRGGPGSPSPSGTSSNSVMTSAEVHASDSTSSPGGFTLAGSKFNPIGGAAAMLEERRRHPGSGPDWLAPADDFDWSENVSPDVYARFDFDELGGRGLKLLTFNKACDFGVDIEGGLGSPLGGKVLVAMVFDGGIARKCGRIHVGDQLMMINGKSLLNVTVGQAEKILQDIALPSAPETVRLYYCESTLVNDEDSVTYF